MGNETVTLNEAISQYFATLKKREDQVIAQQELFRLAQWFGPSRPVVDLKPYEIGEYGQKMDSRGTAPQASDRVKTVRSFLSHVKEIGLIEINLAQHLRSRKSRSRKVIRESGLGQERVEMTKEGLLRLKDEMERLKGERVPISSEIQRAAADKDVRENAPLEAAREQLGHVESRIVEIEATLKIAVLVDAAAKKKRKGVSVGSKVIMKDIDSGREKTITIVSAFEANPLEDKISDVSPVGKALMKRLEKEAVVVESPRGTLRYTIKKIT
ncbi:MAG: transcription elongation factor GreA [SAR202 cluster bacterium]|nr:transcription elongation factor GreA [SAR202 cluster bacterium]